MSKRQKLNDLYEEYEKKFRDREIVFGDGNIDTRILLVGEAPGKDEVRLSKPFVGAAGKNLREFLDILEITRESIYITNTIKYRLSMVNPKTGKTTNRPATREEVIENKDYLHEEIFIIKPEFIVTLGNVPLKAVMGNFNSSIGEVHGRLSTVIIKDSQFKLFPLYHPASIIYNKALKETYIKDINELGVVIRQHGAE